MQSTTYYLHWIAQYLEIFKNEDLQAAVRFIAAIATVTFSSITFYLKLKDRTRNLPPRLACSKTSWDAASKLPVYPLPNRFKIAPFPFIASDLTTRTKSGSGWFTVTELRIWNAGGGVICGPATNPTTAIYVCISKEGGPYEIRGRLSNDPGMSFHLGRSSHNVAAARERIPIYFDFMHAGKGILISIWHNSSDGELIGIKAFSDQAPVLVHGTHHVFRRSVINFMNRLTILLLMPSAIFTAFMFYLGNTWEGAFAALFTWTLISSAYLHRRFILAPEDLGWRNVKAKAP